MAHVQKNLPRIMAAILTGSILISCLLLQQGTPAPTAIPTPIEIQATSTASPLPPATPADTPRPEGWKWSLWTDGTQLHGANIYQRRVFPEMDGTEFYGPGPFGPPYTQADLDRLSALGANYVNISTAGLFTVQAALRVGPASPCQPGWAFGDGRSRGHVRGHHLPHRSGTAASLPSSAMSSGQSRNTSSTRSGRMSPPATPGRRCGSSRRSAIAKIRSSSAMT